MLFIINMKINLKKSGYGYIFIVSSVFGPVGRRKQG